MSLPRTNQSLETAHRSAAQTRLSVADATQSPEVLDVLPCSCGGRRSVIAVVTDPALARTLTALALSSEP